MIASNKGGGFAERVTSCTGSTTSLVIHTMIFIAFFAAAMLNYISWDTMLLVLTTIVSLEAIYLAIFIQMTVNRHATELAEVSEDVEDIQENIEELQEDVEEIHEDVEGETEIMRRKQQAQTLSQLENNLRELLASVEKLQNK